jgi:hypothetical protein
MSSRAQSMASLQLKLTGDDTNKARGTTIGGIQVFSVFDVLTTACAKKDKGAYARKWFGDNIRDESSEYYDEFVDQIFYVQFPGD